MTLRNGSSGNDVLDLQNKLRNLGYTIDTDSVYGNQTSDAVREFQQDYGLDVDGIAGTQTLSKLNELSGTTGGTTTTNYDNLSPVDKAKKLLEEHIGTQPGGFNWKNQADLDAAIEQYRNRDDFTFDLSNDPFYQQYKERYEALGKLAMEDTIGQAAALTGGFGNSYAQTVGQQQYNQYMQQLNGIIPDIYAMQRDRYDAEGQQLLNEISLLDSQKQSDYAQWQNWLNYLQADAQYQEQLALSKQQGSGGGGSGNGGSGNGGSGNTKIPDYLWNMADTYRGSFEDFAAYLQQKIDNGELSLEQGELLLYTFDHRDPHPETSDGY